MSFYPLSLLELSAQVVSLERVYRRAALIATQDVVTEAREKWVGARMALNVAIHRFQESETRRPRTMVHEVPAKGKGDLIFALVDIRESVDRLNQLVSKANLRGGISDEVARLSKRLDEVETIVPILRVLRNAESLGGGLSEPRSIDRPLNPKNRSERL